MDEVVTALEQLQGSKDASKHDRKHHQLKIRSQTNSEPKGCKSSAQETRKATAYPRPSAFV